MHCPGLEPGSSAWKAKIIPLDQQCFMEVSRHRSRSPLRFATNLMVIIWQWIFKLINFTKVMSQAFDQLPEQTRDQMACVFATLLLHDDGQEVSEENVKKVLAAAGLKVQPYWPALFLKAIQGRSIDSLLTCGGGAAQAPAPAAGKTEAPKGCCSCKEGRREG
jgi:large subunit ribosomal protein LP1